MVTAVDTTAVTWNMTIVSDADDDLPPSVTAPDVSIAWEHSLSGKTRTMTGVIWLFQSAP